MRITRQLLTLAIVATLTLTGCQDMTGPELNDATPGAAVTAPGVTASATTVPGHTGRYDTDNNGFPDEGKAVSGHYKALYAYDLNGGWYLDTGDGRPGNPFGTVGSPDELDQATLTECTYVINYRGTYDNDPFMDSGWIQNHINCVGVDKVTYQTMQVHETDPRYTGNPDYFVNGNSEWEYHIDITSGEGNSVRRVEPHSHVGN